MPEFLYIKVAGFESATLFVLKKRLQRKSLPVDFAKFFRRSAFEENLQAAAFRNAFLYKISERLLLYSGDLIYALKKF